MALYKVLTFPDPFLKTVAKPVTVFDDKLRQIASDMSETMYENAGVGLAAVQVGLDMRMFVMDVTYDRDDPNSKNPIVIINPEFLEKKGKQCSEEGCLSVPEYRAEVDRYDSIRIRYQDLDGVEHTKFTSGYESTCMQHETDHLDGKLFIDHLPVLQRNMIKKKLKKHYA